ncbi:MAG: hypothetical protein U0324_05000 [Polyangiales bacterium]
MTAPYIDPTSSLDVLREDLVHLHLRLCRDPAARDLAPTVAAHLAGWRGVHEAQLAHWDAQTAAQVDVALADEALDAHVDEFAADVLAASGGDRQGPRFQLYFPVAPSTLKRPVLGEELEAARRWNTLLADETDGSLRAHADRFAAEVKDADDAVAARAAADAKNAAFRSVGAGAAWVKGAFELRERVWTELDRRRAHDPDAKLPREWASRFFRPRPVAPETEAERAARAAAREKERHDREAAAARRKELAASLKKAQADLRDHDRTAARKR